MLEQLQFDRSFEGSIGLHPLRKYIIKNAWKSFQEDIPVILDNLREQIGGAKRNTEDLSKKLLAISSANLRSLSNTFVLEFLQVVDSIITGSSEGNPTVNGQNSMEEDNGHGFGKWKNAEEHEVDVNPAKVRKQFSFIFSFSFIFFSFHSFFIHFFFRFIHFSFIFDSFFIHFTFFSNRFHTLTADFMEDNNSRDSSQFSRRLCRTQR